MKPRRLAQGSWFAQGWLPANAIILQADWMNVYGDGLVVVAMKDVR